MENIQEILFENKESIPEGIYIKMMNELKIAYSTRNTNDLIKITYTRIRPELRKGDYSYHIDLIKRDNLSLIAKKSDFINSDWCQGYTDEILSQLDKIPFTPFFLKHCNVFKDEGYKIEQKYIITHISKNEPDDSDDDNYDADSDDEGVNKRKIMISMLLEYDIQYLITNVEKM